MNLIGVGRSRLSDLILHLITFFQHLPCSRFLTVYPFERSRSFLFCCEDVEVSGRKPIRAERERYPRCDPGLLTVPELKRWLACHGASRCGRKAELVLRVSEYILTGLDKDLVDPDGGANIERKRAKLEKAGLSSSEHPNLQCAGRAPETGWSKSLRNLPAVSFASLYHHFMERS